MTPPTLHGEHPPGIAGPHLAHGVIGAFDAPARDWPDLAERLMRRGGMTVTIGFGAAHFTREAPVGLQPLPAFAGDDLDPQRCGGGACVLICSDEPTDALTRFGNPVWTRHGQRTPKGALGFRDGTMNPRRQFVPLQRRLSEHDALHAHTTTRGSAVFAVPRNPLLYAQ